MLSPSILITGGTKDSRYKLTRKLMRENAVAAIDTIELTQEKTIGIDQVRSLTRAISLSPIQSTCKIAIIHSAELLTIEAQNALLKTLEEPPKRSIIVLTAQSADTLLPTIVSRCQIIALASSELDYAGVEEYLVFLSQFSQKTVAELLVLASQLGQKREMALLWLEGLIAATRLLLLEQNQALSPSLNVKNDDRGLSEIKTNRLIQIIKALNQGRQSLKANVNPRLTLEVLFFTIMSIVN